MTYILEQGWAKERARLGALARLFDHGTTRHVPDMGIANGWRVLEVGAGSGTLAAWLRERAGDDGEVVFTDLDVRHPENKMAGLLVRPGRPTGTWGRSRGLLREVVRDFMRSGWFRVRRDRRGNGHT